MSCIVTPFNTIVVAGDSTTNIINISGFPWWVELWAWLNTSFTANAPRAMNFRVGHGTHGTPGQVVTGNADNGRPYFAPNGIDGLTAQGIVDRAGTMIYRYNPHGVIVAIGVNDVATAVSPATFTTTINTLDAGIKANCPRNPWVLYVTCGLWGEKWPTGANTNDAAMDANAAAMVSAATALGRDSVNIRTQLMAAEPAANPGNAASGVLTSDGIHYTALGAPLVSGYVRAALTISP